jgi:hypothetical protein
MALADAPNVNDHAAVKVMVRAFFDLAEKMEDLPGTLEGSDVARALRDTAWRAALDAGIVIELPGMIQDTDGTWVLDPADPMNSDRAPG